MKKKYLCCLHSENTSTICFQAAWLHFLRQCYCPKLIAAFLSYVAQIDTAGNPKLKQHSAHAQF